MKRTYRIHWPSRHQFRALCGKLPYPGFVEPLERSKVTCRGCLRVLATQQLHDETFTATK